MVYSMTGYGRAELNIGDKNFLVEIRSLNGKQYDLRLLLPSVLKAYELDVRNILNTGIVRGSVECVIAIKQNGKEKPVTINTSLLKAYYEPVIEVSKELGLSTDNVLSTLLKLPEVIAPSLDVLPEEEWQMFKTLLNTALQQLNAHRKTEGLSLETDLLSRIKNIEKFDLEIQKLEPERRTKIKEGLKRLLEENLGNDEYDKNRLEQELIYYIEKIDISEEQVRLRNHCEYFEQIINEKETSKGKKLSFILQEIGREINTTGSKAYDSEVQKYVVLMKDELEKAKEQILNVL